MKTPLLSFVMLLSLSASFNAHADAHLRLLKLDAETNLATLKGIETQVKSGTPYSPCFADRLLVQKSYIQWFLNHYEDFSALDQEIDEQLEPVNEALSELKKIEVKLSKKDYRIQQLIPFFKSQFSRAKTITDDQKTIFESQLENPLLNSPEISRKDAQALVQTIIAQVNKKQSSKISFQSSFENYGMKLSVQFQLKLRGIDEQVTLPFDDTLKINHEGVWEILMNKKILLSSYSIHGSERYQEIQNQKINPACKHGYAIKKSSALELYSFQSFQYPGAADEAHAHLPATTRDFIAFHPLVKLTVSENIESTSNVIVASPGKSGCIFYNLDNRSYTPHEVLRVQPIPGETLSEIEFYPVNSKGWLQSRFKIVCHNVSNDFQTLADRLKNTGFDLIW